MAFQLYGVLVANANDVGQSVQGLFLLPSKKMLLVWARIEYMSVT